MTDEAFQELRVDHTAKRFAMSDQKSQAYTQGSDDRLYNFKELARMAKTTPHEVLTIYMGKHWMALMAWLNQGIVPSDGVANTIADIQNYCDLALAMFVEAQSESHD